MKIVMAAKEKKAVLMMKVIVKVSSLVILKVISDRNEKRLEIRSSLMKIVMTAKEKKSDIDDESNCEKYHC